MRIQERPEQDSKKRDHLVRLLRQLHRTKTPQVTEKVAMTEVLKAHQKFPVKSPSGKRTALYKLQERKLPRAKFSCNYGHVPECSKFKAPGGCRFGDKCAHKHTAKLADETEIQQRLQSTSQKMMNARCIRTISVG